MKSKEIFQTLKISIVLDASKVAFIKIVSMTWKILNFSKCSLHILTIKNCLISLYGINKNIGDYFVSYFTCNLFQLFKIWLNDFLNLLVNKHDAAEIVVVFFKLKVIQRYRSTIFLHCLKFHTYTKVSQTLKSWIGYHW